ncbi:MAG: response regulator [Planctomycetota bacterium]
MQFRILIVDDSLTVRKDLEAAFAADGYFVTLCATLDAARQALAHSSYALIVLDVVLPDGDGIDFLREVKANRITATLPVMLLTSETQVAERLRGLTIGAGDYVGKPYDLSYVLSRAREMIRTGRPTEPPDSAPHILLIDDSITYREEFRASLESAGYNVLTAGSGEEGLQIAMHRRPALAVVDGQLPGIDGPTVIRRLRMDTALRNMPCVMLTASLGYQNEVTVLDSGADAYITKNADFGIILARITAVLRSADTPSATLASQSGLGPKKILAIDDSLTYLHRLADELRAEGYDPVLANSGEDALELLTVQPVDCILLDLVMPGLSGQDTCRRIKRSPAWRDIPLLILTATSESDSMIAGINAGADDYILKSGDFEILKARLRAQLRRKQFEDENRNIREQLVRKEVEAAEARAAKQLASTRARLLHELEEKNREMESFSYAVSHDLRAPLRAITSYSDLMLEEAGETLPPNCREYLERISRASRAMHSLIDDLLALSRVTRREFKPDQVDLTGMVQTIAETLRQNDPERKVEFAIESGLIALADRDLIHVALENLLRNAWKYTGRHPAARIEFGRTSAEGRTCFFVRDDGAGFDMAYAGKLFTAFQRLHGERDFEGTGIGLATVLRVIERHGGAIWAEAAVEQGATFFFTLAAPGSSHPAAGA